MKRLIIERSPKYDLKRSHKGRIYKTRPCPICRTPVKINGWAWVSHGRRHVRECIADEHRDHRGKIFFVPAGKAVTAPKFLIIRGLWANI